MTEIVSTSDKLAGKPRIEGTRVSAEQVYEMHTLRGMSFEEIAEQLPTVDLEGVKAAVKFMEKHSGSEDAVEA